MREGTPMTLDELLAQPGPLVAAWDLRSREDRLQVFRVGESGASLLGHVDVGPKEREETSERARDRRVRVGSAHDPFVWVIDDVGFALWSPRARVAQGTRDELYIGRDTVQTRDISQFEIFVAADMRQRAVRVVTPSRTLIVAEQHLETPYLDPTYNSLELDEELAWAEFLGRDLALWRRVPFVDRHGKVTNQRQSEIYAVTCALAAKVKALPEQGPFEFVFETIGPIDKPGDVVLRLAPDPLEDERRFVELRVHTPSGKSWSGRWLKLGSNKQLVRYLTDVRTPARIMLDARELARKLVENDYE